MPCPVTALTTCLKVAGTASLGVLVGTSFTSSAYTLPSVISTASSPSALPRTSAVLLDSALASLRDLTTSQSSLTFFSTASFVVAWIVSPWRRKHPYLLWTALLAGAGNVAVLLNSPGVSGSGISRDDSKTRSSSNRNNNTPSRHEKKASSATHSPNKKQLEDGSAAGASKKPAGAPYKSEGLAASTTSFSKIDHSEVSSTDEGESDAGLDSSIYHVKPHHKQPSSLSSSSSFGGRESGPEQSQQSHPQSTTSSDRLDAETPTVATFGVVNARARAEREQTVQAIKFGVWGLSFLTALVGLWGER